jgi:hypothetical protein
MSKALAFALCSLLLLVLSSPASAGCTASLSCNNSCRLFYTCPSPYPPCDLVCIAPSQTISCTGTSVCSVGSSSVTCDGVTTSCPTASQCVQGLYFIKCGAITRQCTYNCPL